MHPRRLEHVIKGERDDVIRGCTDYLPLATWQLEARPRACLISSLIAEACTAMLRTAPISPCQGCNFNKRPPDYTTKSFGFRPPGSQSTVPADVHFTPPVIPCEE